MEIIYEETSVGLCVGRFLSRRRFEERTETYCPLIRILKEPKVSYIFEEFSLSVE